MKKRKPNLRGKVKISGDKIYISSTSFQSFCKCPMRGYYDKFTPDEVLPILKDSIPIAALEFGGVIHTVMENHLKGKTVSFEKLWGGYKHTEMQYSYRDKNWQNLNQVGSSMLKRLRAICDANEITPYKGKEGYTVEIQDMFKCGGDVYLTRTFDAVCTVNGVPSVVDFKTAANKYSEGNQEVISEQLTAYMLPHSIPEVPQPEQAVFIVGTKTKSPNGQLIIVERSEERQNQFLEDMKVIADMIRGGNYFRNRSTMNCGTAEKPYCPYYDLCYK